MELFWWCLGISLIVLEFILPGLVSVFVGLGGLTVAALMHFGIIDGLASQFITWFVASLVYIFSLRLLVMRYYPSDTQRTDIDADDSLVGLATKVVVAIPDGGVGRVAHGESTWPAKGEEGRGFPLDAAVRIVGRDNITCIVEECS